jgi:hypothetical protein
MTTFTATADDSTGAVTLSIVQTSSVTAITRSNGNGVAGVRAAAGQVPTPTTGTTIITDFEAGEGLNTYTAYVPNEGGGVTQLAASATLTLPSPMLLVPIAPNYSEFLESVTDYSAGRESNSTVHTIIGRSDPIVVLGKLGTRRGTLELWAASLTEAARLVRVFDRGETVMLKQTVAGMDMYFTALTVDVGPYTPAGEATRYKVTVSYQEVALPFGNLAGAFGWTFDALATAFPSFDAVLAAYSTFDDLTIGDNS